MSRQIVAALASLLFGIPPCTSLDRAFAQRSNVPRDGTFHVEARPAFVFKVTLAEDWVCPHAGDGTLHAYAPVLPELPSQGKVSTRFFVAANNKLQAEEVTEEGNTKRKMLALPIPANELSPK